MNANQILSLKKANRTWIESQIAEKEESIKLELPNIFSDVHSADFVSKELKKKLAKNLIMILLKIHTKNNTFRSRGKLTAGT